MFNPHNFHALYNSNQLKSTRPFLARGAQVQRCASCFLAATACCCEWRIPLGRLPLDWIVLFHHDEIFKPTNTGRLIGDVFPQNTYAFEWSRKYPHADLLAMLQDPQRLPVLVFPSQEAPTFEMPSLNAVSQPGPRLTFVVLDGTWRQASRMARSSDWLQGFPCLQLTDLVKGNYGVRQAIREGQLSTVEAACEVLELRALKDEARHLKDYFTVFNEHCLATRGSRSPVETEAHRRLNLVKHVNPLDRM
jgi:DTW domain-containing protein